jgi:hypothetical protein
MFMHKTMSRAIYIKTDRPKKAGKNGAPIKKNNTFVRVEKDL